MSIIEVVDTEGNSFQALLDDNGDLYDTVGEPLYMTERDALADGFALLSN